MSAAHKDGSISRLRVMFLTIALFWSVLIVVLAGWNCWQSYSATFAIALTTARESYSKDLVYRRWTTMHGGVYVPITSDTLPNPYLSHIPERDIVTPAGRKLTLINPAYMTRQVHELGEKEYGPQGHITSLKPIRPENAPDPWERGALQAFEQGQTESSSLETIGNETYLRFMHPLLTEAGCLKCHASQGYKIGDIRGGISVSVPWGPFQLALREQLRGIVLAYGGIWMVGMLGLYLSRRGFQNHLSARQQAEEALIEKTTTLDNILRNANNIAIATVDLDFHITYYNPMAEKLFGYSAEQVIGKTIQEMHTREAVAPERFMDAIEQVRSKGEYRYFLEQKTASGIRHIASRVSGIISPNGDITGYSLFSEDITASKHAEEERQQLEECLHRSQKMEALGKLAGGVAHDLNNVLGVLSGYSELLLERLPEGSPLRTYAANILKSSEKGANHRPGLADAGKKRRRGRRGNQFERHCCQSFRDS